ncbi:MAG TPA: PA14 domain-containing protein, partial [Lacipirellulaceae bacterium]|nr:PA14 domain-containing protein [Lacipirellulaceae bacterium]
LDNAGQNWDIMVTSHELGHNLGTPHTHNYCPPVDECAPAGWYGQCQSQQVCTNQGTIMSYCHLCSGGLSNVKLTFADASIQSMDAHLNSLPCNYSGATLAPWAVPDFVAGFQSTFVIDVLANDLPVNCQDVVIHSFTQPTSGPGVVTLLSGAGPNGRDVLQFSAPTWFNGVSTFSYTIRNTSNLVSAASPVTVTIPTLTLGKSVVNALPNLSVLYFDLVNPTQLPIFDLLNPYLQTTTPHINYPSTNGNFANSNRADYVGALWTGWIQIPEPGLWTFFLESDDGSRLLLNDQLVINNDGLHGMLEKSATVALGKGHHKLRVEFFEAGGGAGCILSMSGPGVPKAPVPPARFSRGGSILAADLNYDGVVNGADLAVMLGLWNTPSPLADLNGDGNVDGADLAILLGSWSN